MKSLLGVWVAVLIATPTSAQTFATWNVGAAWDAAIESRAPRFAAAAAAIGADVYVLQEVTSLAGAETIARHLGMTDPYVVVSDFAATQDQQDDNGKANVFFHLEVAVVSSLPICRQLNLNSTIRIRPDPSRTGSPSRSIVPGCSSPA